MVFQIWSEIFFQMAGSTSYGSSSSSLVSLVFLSFLINIVSVWVSDTPTLRKKKHLPTSLSIVPTLDYLWVVALLLSSQPRHLSPCCRLPQIYRLVLWFVSLALAYPRFCIHSRTLKFVWALFCVSLCSRSISCSDTVQSFCQNDSSSLVICQSWSGTNSPTPNNSAPISPDFILSIKKSSPHLL